MMISHHLCLIVRKAFGKWTMVYDEGFEIELEGVKYFAFSRYGPAKNGGFESYCS
jgi:cathepsin C